MKHILIGVLALFSLMGAVFFLEQQQASAAVEAGDHQIDIRLLGPYGQKISQAEDSFPGGLTRSRSSRTNTKVTINLETVDEDNRYTRKADSQNPDFCGEGGGDYYIKHLTRYKKAWDNKEKRGVTDEPVFHCLTAKELMNKITIPNDWENETLTLYCSDTGETPEDLADGNKNSLSSFLLSSIQEGQVGCLLKNEDRTTNATLFYGFPYGNVQLEKDSDPFYNKSNESIPLLEGNGYKLVSDFNIENPFTFTLSGGIPIPTTTQTVMQYNHSTRQNDSIYISYINNSYDPYFVISRSNKTIQDSSLSFTDTINQGEIKDDTARTLFLRKFENRTIYGYQSQESLAYNLPTSQRKQDPLYVIYYEGFEPIKQTCLKSLSAYNSTTALQGSGDSTSVVCKQNDIYIQADTLNKKSKQYIGVKYEDLGFSIFKNTILEANGVGESTMSSTTAGSVLNGDRYGWW